jgi:dihydrolipoamide dehydrogenase
MNDLTCDVAIIGAGTAGLAAERSARAAGATTLLIDDRFAGTTCATVGCMPSKLLIAAAHAAHAVRSAAVFGIAAQPAVIDGPAVLRRVRSERDRFVSGTFEAIDKIPAEIRVHGRARFVDATTLALDDDRRIIAKAIVIATGARPHVPEMFAALGDRVLTNETVFDLPDLPKSIAVVGAGALGLELAQAFVRLGVRVAIFDQAERLAALHDAAVERELHAILARELEFHLGVSLTVERSGDGARLRWTGTSAGAAEFDYVLVATGRPPQLKTLDLAKTGLALDEHGTPHFDRATLQCGASAIFLAGDADADRPVLHEASAEGAIAGRNAASFPAVEPAERGAAFSIMFTDPPMAVLGKPPEADSVIGAASYADQGRAKVEARNAGLVHLSAERPDGRLTGATLVGPGMDHIAHLLVWAIDRGETATGLLELPFYHPTFEEGLKTALRAICKAVHAPLPRDRDTGAPAGA